LQLPESDAVVAWGDFDTVALALRNLIENALRYSEGADVTLEVRLPSKLIVRDFGPGVAQPLLNTIAQRHVRQSSSTAGYGLGLSIVSTIVEKHEGTIKFFSPPVGYQRGFEACIDLTAKV
jgi:two-component system, OmpR family, sensor kinase